MFILVEGRVYNSDDTPVMVLFGQAEVQSFRSQPANSDIHCSFPPEWNSEKGQKWMEKNKIKLVNAKKDDFVRSLKRREKMPINSSRIVSDEMIKKFFGKMEIGDYSSETPKQESSGSAKL